MLFPRKSVRQAAALPFVSSGGTVEALLITSRRRGHWILPKGWAAGKASLSEAAAREAEEEAGVVGPIDDTPVGTYSYTKRMRVGYEVRCQVFVYPLLVVKHLVTWREQEDRHLCWCTLTEAAERVDDRGLSGLLRRLAQDDGRALRQLTDPLSSRAALEPEAFSTQSNPA